MVKTRRILFECCYVQKNSDEVKIDYKKIWKLKKI